MHSRYRNSPEPPKLAKYTATPSSRHIQTKHETKHIFHQRSSPNTKKQKTHSEHSKLAQGT